MHLRREARQAAHYLLHTLRLDVTQTQATPTQQDDDAQQDGYQGPRAEACRGEEAPLILVGRCCLGNSKSRGMVEGMGRLVGITPEGHSGEDVCMPWGHHAC